MPMFTFLLSTVGAALLFALVFYFRKQSMRYLPPTTAFFVEVVVEVILISLFFVLSSPVVRKGFDIRSKGVLFALLAGVTVTIGVGLNYLALKSGYLSKVIAITSPSQIMFGVFLGVLLAKEVLSVRQILGTILGVVAVIIIGL